MSTEEAVKLAAAMPQKAAAANPKNVLIVGVGGQGVIMVSKVLATLCQVHGFDVKQSEVHGMAKRGGAVFSHVRFGERVYSPTIPRGEADVLLALEWAEAMRWLPYLDQKKGTFIADTQQIIPPFACRDRKRGAKLAYSNENVAQIIEAVPQSYALDAVEIATKLGVARAANTVLLGALSTALEFSEEAWREVIARFVPPKTVTANLLAFEQGQLWATDFDQQSRPEFASEAIDQVTTVQNRETLVEDLSMVEIEAAWCKGCDICVRFCPEHCLRMNAQQIVEMAHAERCTGCRICEWLCPDFAITVHSPA